MIFYIHTLGCKVNSYESKVMSDTLINNGYKKGSIDDANIVIVNTCFVTNVAEKKSLQMIRKFKKENRIIIVTGCLSQVKPEALEDVDIILGNQDKSKIVDYIKEYQGQTITKLYDLNKMEFEEMKLNNFDKTRAFVKIQDGCENFCTYCIIPYTRGKLRCKSKEDVIEEITNLVSNNHKEIVLTGIHTGSYKIGDYTFTNLIKDILKIKGLVNLRISSIEISEITDELLDMFSKNKVLADHIHIPLQSGSNEILKQMNRKYDKEYFINKVNKIRSYRPTISLTTDVIVGFPGETDELFEETIETIKKANFSKIHVFPYSQREGTVAAKMENQISEVIKKQRVRKLLDISLELEQNYMKKFLQQEVIVIPEVYKDGYLIGHTTNYLSVKFKGNEKLLHDCVNVKLEEMKYPFMIGSEK